MKRRILLFLLALALWPAFALANVCTCTGACTIAAAAGWTGAATCTDAGGPDQSTDALVVASGGTLTWDQTGTRVYDYLWTQPGGTTTVSVSPVVMQFNGPALSLFGLENAFAVGNSADARGTFTSNGKDLTISWTGAGGGVMVSLGPQPFGGFHDTGTNYTAVTMRGPERASTFVTAYSRGATAPTPDTNMVDCADGAVAPTDRAVGDTIVFTTGKSQDFWYEVSCFPDACTGAGAPAACCSAADATTECSATACNGGPCDYQITRNSTGSTPGSVAGSKTWDSMVMIAGVGGPFRHATPVDDDANGAANGDGLLPAIGDKFVVFKPVLIQGGANPITNGILVHWTGAGVDLRYVEMNKMSGQDTEDCNGGSGGAGIWDVAAKITSAEGAMEFVNIHNFASRQGMWEVGQTDRTDDARPNVPRTYKHFYIHDVDVEVDNRCSIANASCTGAGAPKSCCTGAGTGNCDLNQLMASGITYFMDQADGTQDGITMDGFHFARWGSGLALGVTASGTQPRKIEWRNLIAHDYPGIAGYGTAGGKALGFQKGSVLAEGVSVWDLGSTSSPGSGISSDFANASSFSVRNGFFVNLDANSLGANDNFNGVMISGGELQNTSGAVLSNSYMKRVVGMAVAGGRSRFNFIKDMNMEDDGAAPCTSGERAAIHGPVELTGNVITRSHALSCTGEGVAIRSVSSASQFTNETRKIVSNVFHNMDTDVSVYTAGLFYRDDGPGMTRDIDFYNNVVDMNDNVGGPDTYGILALNAVTGKLTAFYNIFRGMSQTASRGIQTNTSPRDEGYNRFSRVTTSPPMDGAAPAASDIDSDADSDLFVDRANLRYGAPCWSSEFKRNPWGGPVGPLRFGIQSFSWFHPAVIPLMDADAFKRYDWRECSRSYQDLVPR